MVFFDKLERLQQLIYREGPKDALAITYKALRRRLISAPVMMHPFDIENGTDTSGLLLNNSLRFNHKHAKYSTAYYGTHPSLFEAVAACWKRTIQEPLTSYKFIDIGCGKGRVLLMASELPFLSVTGIDLSEQLVNTARKNIDRWIQQPRACSSITVLCSDALSVPIPSGPVAIYMYHPFGEAVMKPFLEHLISFSSRSKSSIDLLYVNPVLLDLVLSTTGGDLLSLSEHVFTSEEFRADVLQDPKHRFAIIRLPS